MKQEQQPLVNENYLVSKMLLEQEQELLDAEEAMKTLQAKKLLIERNILILNQKMAWL